MGKEVQISVNERAFLWKTLALNKRADGRTPFDFRPITVNILDGDDKKRFGQCEVSVGKTR
jgi:exosome complex RNA-binding protein Rrp42 (RNase PH superfamily)